MTHQTCVLSFLTCAVIAIATAPIARAQTPPAEVSPATGPSEPLVPQLAIAPPAGPRATEPSRTHTAPAPVSSNRPVVGTSPALRAPDDYLIGPEDVLSIVFWRHKDMSGDVVVRPDGKITLPLLNDVQAARRTPEQLRLELIERAGHFVEDPTATVIVKQIHSRKVFITGQVEKPGPYQIFAPTTVIQLIAMAGGLREFADGERILIMRLEGDRPVGYNFNYKHVSRRLNMRQNIELKPGDTVIVP